MFARVNSAEEAEEILLEAISAVRTASKTDPPALHMFRRKAGEEFAKASQLVTRLERVGGGFGDKRIVGMLPGRWELILTNSRAVEKNGGSITGLGSLPGASCLGVVVDLEKGGKAKTTEKIKVFAGLMEGENCLEGKWSFVKGGILEVTYAQAVLMGKSKVRADSKAVLRTTYCSRQIRVGRSESGEFYVFERK